jgi:conjugal transfer pilus assembly protein TraV
MTISIRIFALAGLAAALAASGCSTNTKGAWACPADRGVTCQSIAALDGGKAGARQSRSSAKPSGVGAVRWWDGNETLTGNFDLAPRREPDQFLKVLIGGWTDAGGDYHAPSEVFAVMRHGGWWAPPPATPLAPPRVAARPEKGTSSLPAAAKIPDKPAAAQPPSVVASTPAVSSEP